MHDGDLTKNVPGKALAFSTQHDFACENLRMSGGESHAPSEVWLRAESENRAFYPDEFGHFNLQEASLLFGAVLVLKGPIFLLLLHQV